VGLWRGGEGWLTLEKKKSFPEEHQGRKAQVSGRREISPLSCGETHTPKINGLERRRRSLGGKNASSPKKEGVRKSEREIDYP